MKKQFLLCVTLFATLQPISSAFGQPPPLTQEEASVVVLGGGVGALTSALYLSRAGLQPIVIEGPQPGGLITQSHAVQNWPGELEISGFELVGKLRKQAQANGVRFYPEEVMQVDFSKRPFQIITRSLDDEGVEHRFRAEGVIIAMGTQPNYLGIPGETGPTGYWGRGVTNCAICDGNLYRDKTVGVVGGGDAAVVEALYLSNIAKRVHLFVRKEGFKGVEAKRLETLLAKPNVDIQFQTTVEEIKGDGAKVTGVVLKNKGKTRDFPLDGLFLAIGSKPNTRLFQGTLQLDPQGYIALKKDQQTSIEGVYAIGDIVDPVYKQAISAAGDGAKAALQAQQYLSDRANQLIAKKGDETKAVAGIYGAQQASVHADASETKAHRGEQSSRSDREAPLSKPEVIEITSVEQFERELKSDMPVFVDFYASWCGPCKQISPRIERSAEHLAGQVKFLKVNVDRVGRLSHRYDVRAMPTVLVFQPDGHISDRKVGSDQITNLLKSLEKGAAR